MKQTYQQQEEKIREANNHLPKRTAQKYSQK